MNTVKSKFPSRSAMKNLCLEGSDQLMVPQTVGLFFITAPAFLVVFGVPVILASTLSFVAGKTFLSSNVHAIMDLAQSTGTDALFAAATATALAIFGRLYLRAQFGQPYYYSELQVDLDKETVLELCNAYMNERSVDELYVSNPQNGRIIGLVDETNNHLTYLEVTAIEREDEQCFLALRAASIVTGRAALLSSFYTDFGACKTASNAMLKLFSPYASRRRRPGRITVAPARPIMACPPPLWQKVGYR